MVVGGMLQSIPTLCLAQKYWSCFETGWVPQPVFGVK